MNTEERKQHDLLLRRDGVQSEFQGYYYDEKRRNCGRDGPEVASVRLMK